MKTILKEIFGSMIALGPFIWIFSTMFGEKHYPQQFDKKYHEYYQKINLKKLN